MTLNTVDFSDDVLNDFYKGEIVDVNVNGSYFGKIELFSDKIILSSVDDDGNGVMVEYDDINTLIDDLETMRLEL